MEHRFELVEGRTVLLQIAEGEYRPAVVVKVWNPDPVVGCANLVVFLDGPNDNRFENLAETIGLGRAGTMIGYASSRDRGTAVGQWITPQELVTLRAQA